MRKRNSILLILLGTLLAVILLFPIYLMILSSFKPIDQVFDLRILPDFSSLTLKNYQEVLQTDTFGLFMWNSLVSSVAVTLAALLFHSMAGYTLARLEFPGKKLVFGWMMSTLMVPFAVIMIPLFFIAKGLGITNSLWGIIFPMIPNAYGIFLFRQFYLGIPRSLEESAHIDGASYFGSYWRVVMPLSAPIAITLALTFFVTNWNRYLWPLIVNQKRAFWVIQVGIATFKDDKEMLWNLILAASCLAALPTLLTFSFFQRYIVEGIKMTGLKG